MAGTGRGCAAVSAATGALSRWSVLGRLDPPARARFLTALRPRAVVPGEVLCRQDETDDHLLVLLDGACEIARTGPRGGAARRSLRASPGIVGHWSLLPGGVAARTVTMLGAGRVLSMPLSDLRRLLVEPLLATLPRPAPAELCGRARAGYRHLHLGRGLRPGTAGPGELHVVRSGLRRALATLPPEPRYSVGGGSAHDNEAAAFLMLQAGFEVWAVERRPDVAVFAPARAPAGSRRHAAGATRPPPRPQGPDWDRVLEPALARLGQVTREDPSARLLALARALRRRAGREESRPD